MSSMIYCCVLYEFAMIVNETSAMRNCLSIDTWIGYRLRFIFDKAVKFIAIFETLNMYRYIFVILFERHYLSHNW